jgi:hypothetical protein
MPARSPTEPMPAATPESTSDPVAAYTSEMPKRNTAEESAPTRKYFNPASTLPRFDFENATSAYDGSDTISKATNTTANEFATARSDIPVAANRVSE